MKRILFIILLFFSTLLKAQPEIVDSLKNIILTSNDSSRVKALIELGKIKRRENLDSGIFYFDQAYQKAATLGFIRGQLLSLTNIGISYGMNDQYDKAILNFQEALNLAKAYNFPSFEETQYINLGIVFKRLGDYAKSYEYYNSALEIAKREGFPMVGAYSNLAIIHDLMKEYEKSYDFYKKVLHYYDSTGNTSLYMNTLGNLAIYYEGIEDYNKAISISRDVLNYSIENGITYSIYNNASNLSYFYCLAGNYDSAIYFANIVIDSAEIPSTRHITPTAYHNRSLAHYHLGHYEKSLTDAEQSLRLSQGLGYSFYQQAYLMLFKIYEAQGNFAEALSSHKLYKAFSDSLFNEEKLARFKAEEVKQNVFEKNRQLEAQKNELEALEVRAQRDRYFIYLFIAVTLAMLAIMAFLYQRFLFKNRLNDILNRKNALILRQKEQIEEINEVLETKMLRAQINPHFIFNALNSIQHFITIQDREKALRFLTKFASLLRQILENSINVKVPIADEIKYLKLYLDLEALRFDNGFTYEIKIMPGVDIHGQEIPVLLLQPFAENAIIHGLIPKDGEKKLEITISDEAEHIVYAITDNGIGRENATRMKATKTSRKGRGLSITTQRIENLNSTNHKAEVVVIDLVDPEGHPEGTTVVIRIPKG